LPEHCHRLARAAARSKLRGRPREAIIGPVCTYQYIKEGRMSALAGKVSSPSVPSRT
jgi:hypothetical protein